MSEDSVIRLETCTGIYRIAARHDIKLWCDCSLFVVQKCSNQQPLHRDLMDTLREHFLSLMFGHETEVIAEHLDAVQKEKELVPKPPALLLKPKDGTKNAFSRKSRYRNQITEQKNDDISILVIPPIQLKTISDDAVKE